MEVPRIYRCEKKKRKKPIPNEENVIESTGRRAYCSRGVFHPIEILRSDWKRLQKITSITEGL